jgi:hypothetical protein
MIGAWNYPAKKNTGTPSGNFQKALKNAQKAE